MSANDGFSGAPVEKPSGLDESGTPYKVLIVDDSITMRKIISRALKTEAYDIVAEASNGRDAVEHYKKLKPDLVTLDINMPELNGKEALKQILAFDPAARIIMLTSESDRHSVIEAMAYGAKDYIVKPPDRIKLCEKVKKILQS